MMPNMGGNIVSTETLFSSPPVQNPNFNFMPFHSFPSIAPVSNNFPLLVYTLCTNCYVSSELICCRLLIIYFLLAERRERIADVQR